MLSFKDYSYIKNNKCYLNKINLTLNSGEIICLFGHENSGKTLFQKAICKKIKASSGPITVFNSDIKQFTRKNFLRIISHPFNITFNDNETVIDIITKSRSCITRFLKPVTLDDREIISDNINTFNLTKIYNKRFKQLSGGEKQRVLLAYQFTRGAEILILHNPLYNLEQRSISLLQKNIFKYTINGDRIVIIDSKNYNFCLDTADRIITLNKGKILLDKEPNFYSEEILKKIIGTELYLTKNVSTGKNIIVPVNNI